MSRRNTNIYKNIEISHHANLTLRNPFHRYEIQGTKSVSRLTFCYSQYFTWNNL